MARRCADFLRWRGVPARRAVYGNGWNQDLFDGAHTLPTRADLDTLCPNHPLLLDRVCGRIMLCNIAALTAAGGGVGLGILQPFRLIEGSVGGAGRADRCNQPSMTELFVEQGLVHRHAQHLEQQHKRPGPSQAICSSAGSAASGRAPSPAHRSPGLPAGARRPQNTNRLLENGAIWNCRYTSCVKPSIPIHRSV